MSNNRGWTVILVAGLLEVVWATAMGYSEGFTILPYTLMTVLFLALSTYMLSRALDMGVPVGVAYAVWVGIGSVGTVMLSVALGNEVMTVAHAVLVMMIILGVVGLQVTGNHEVDTGRE